MNHPDTISVDMAIAERRLAETMVVAEIESFGRPVKGLWPRMYDVTHLLDEREQPQPLIDMHREVLAYAQWRELIRTVDRTPAGEPATVRILRDAA